MKVVIVIYIQSNHHHRLISVEICRALPRTMGRTIRQIKRSLQFGSRVDEFDSCVNAPTEITNEHES
jgi:hypothetical protein